VNGRTCSRGLSMVQSSDVMFCIAWALGTASLSRRMQLKAKRFT
jgi:hypothetical protein